MVETQIGSHPNTTWLAMFPCASIPRPLLQLA